MTPNFNFFGGYVWYAFPTTKPPVMGLPALKHSFPIKDFVGLNSYSNYSEEGVIFITDDAKKPEIPLGWVIVPFCVPDGFGGKVNGNTVVRHIYTLNETQES